MGEASFVKVMRAGLLDAFDLISEHRPAFLLLFFIAMRARRIPSDKEILGVGEVKVGCRHIATHLGLSEAEYRTAKRILETAGMATFRATNRGTIAKLESTAIFDPNLVEHDGLENVPTTDGKHDLHELMTTNKKEEEKKKGRVGENQGMTYEARVEKEFEQIMADHAQLSQWEIAFTPIDIAQQIQRAKAWLIANPRKQKKNFKRFLVNWFTSTNRPDNFAVSRPVSPQFAMKMQLEYENNMKKLNDEKDILEAALAECVGDESKKRLSGELKEVMRKISDLGSNMPRKPE